jgi:hypothetical protein
MYLYLLETEFQRPFDLEAAASTGKDRLIFASGTAADVRFNGAAYRFF